MYTELSYAITDTQQTQLGESITREVQEHGANSGFRLLGSGLDAFATRLILMEAAEHSLDVQYYLFRKDTTSKLFTHYLLKAADRGVRVRMLLDDFGHEGQEALFSALIQHPNISIQLFNPFANRILPYLGFITSFSRANRRMHNKSFIADNQAAIIGGRNIGDTYFAADLYTNFSDLDVLGIGEFASKVSEVFDLYWNHKLAVPVEQLAKKSNPHKLTKVREQLLLASTSERSRQYVERLQSLALLDELKSGEIKLYWAQSELVYDHPDKMLNAPTDDTGHMAPALMELLADANHEALIVSPYFIPGNTGVDMFKDWIHSGASVTVLTNSLSANDVPLVHAGYAAYRKSLIKAGVTLWELQPTVKWPKKRRLRNKKSGSSKASLHAKSMVFDRDTMFVGSMNLDPRSINLNTEIGVVIFNSTMADFASNVLKQELPHHAWRLDIEKSKRWWGQSETLIWLDESTSPATLVSKGSEPEATRWRRFQAWLFKFLPLERLL